MGTDNLEQNIESIFTSVFLSGRDEYGNETNFITGGLEVYEAGRRFHNVGFSFFIYAMEHETRLLTFPDYPPWLMIPFMEKRRYEFYLSPEIKILNRPLIFNSSGSRITEVTGMNNVSRYEGRLEELQGGFRLKDTRFRITDGRLFAQSISDQFYYERSGFILQKNINSVENSLTYSTPILRRHHGLEEFFKGSYLLHLIESSAPGLHRISNSPKKSRLFLPGLSLSSQKQQSHFRTRLDIGGFWNLLQYDESTTAFSWLSLRLDQAMETEFNEDRKGLNLKINKEESKSLSISIRPKK